MAQSSYDTLIQKLDGFIRKYYLNQTLRGVLYSIGLVGGFFLLIALLEHFGRFGTGIRTLLFWTFTAATLFVIGRFIVIPLVKLYRLGKVISYEQASRIIGKHFSEVEDKLLNTLQLKGSQTDLGVSHALIEASIDQKAAELRPVPFDKAIDLRANRKYLKYSIPPLAILLIILFAAPSVIKDSTDRLVRHGEDFVPEAPFQFILENEELSIPAQSDLTLELRLEGDAFPPFVQLVVDGNRYRMEREDPRNHRYTLKNVRAETDIRFSAQGFDSKSYTIEVLPKPVLTSFQIDLDYPAYIGMADERIRNTGDLTIPMGTQARWSFQTKDTEAVQLRMGEETIELDPQDGDYFDHQARLMESTAYVLKTQNTFMTSPDSMRYTITVVPDRYPEIQVDAQQDSLNDRNLYFRGEARDDYGLSRLVFHHKLVRGGVRVDSLSGTEALGLNAGTNAQGFYHAFSLDQLYMEAGDEVEYYFEIWDNDGILGPKSTRSRVERYEAPSLDELEEEREQTNDELKADMKESIEDAKELQKEIDALRKELLEKEELDWRDKKKIEQMLERQKKLQEDVQEMQQKNEQQMQKEEQFQSMDENLLEKQRQLQELFQQVMSPEMQQMYEEMQRLMEEMDQDKIREQLEQMELSNEDIEAELDRNLELFKQMEFEQKAEDIKSDLEELAEKQAELAEETESGEKSDEELKEEQEKLNQEFEKIQEALDDLEKLNEELEEKNDMDMMGLEEATEQDMEQSSESLEEGDNQDASDSQQGASEKMQQMAQMMDMMAGGGGAEQQSEDLDALRALLENIIELSFAQEGVMGDLQTVETDDPKYLEYAQTQRKLKDDAVVIKDSLRALAKRVIEIQPIVNQEINAINMNMDRSISELAERKTGEATTKQQYVMTSLNNLALLLDEALQQMQQAMANSMPGTGNCQKPGGKGQGKPGKKPGDKPGSMSQMQKALSKRLDELRKGMQQNGKAGPGRFGMSEQLARTAAEQAAIRRQLEEMGNELNKDGSGAGNELKEIAKEMEETERDIVNMEITKKTLERQQEILTKLLKSEKAMREQEQDEKRKSTEARDYGLSAPENFFEYQKQKEREVELLRTIPPSLKPYYKKRVNEYFLNFDGSVTP